LAKEDKGGELQKALTWKEGFLLMLLGLFEGNSHEITAFVKS
jgi:hypothetical protein